MYCEWCKRHYETAHKHHKDKCIECARRYNRYIGLKKRCRDKSLTRSLINLDRMEIEYKELYDIGCKVPVELQVAWSRGAQLRRNVPNPAVSVSADFVPVTNKVIENKLVDTPVVTDIKVRNKACKQCLKVLPDTAEYFRPYKPRGKGLRQTTVGRNTVCRDCERANSVTTQVWKMKDKTPKELEFLEVMAKYYIALVDKGGDPIGTYAKHVLETRGRRDAETGYKPTPRVSMLDRVMAMATDTLENKDTEAGDTETEEVVDTVQPEDLDDLECSIIDTELSELGSKLGIDPVIDGYYELLRKDLVDEPDVYQDELDALRDQSLGADGRVSAEYMDLFQQAAERIDSYEDAYVW